MQDSFFQKINSFSGNTSVVWLLVCLTEALMIKALIITNFKQFSGINDSFFSRFACLINIGFSLGSHIALFFLGSLGSDEILTGIQGKPRQISPFYELTIGALSTFSCLSLMAIGFKTFEAYRKDKKLVKDVNVMINNTKDLDSRRNSFKKALTLKSFTTPLKKFREDNSNILPFPVPAINVEERPKSAPPDLPILDKQPKLKLINKRELSQIAFAFRGG